MDYVLKSRNVVVKDIEEALKSVNFSKLSNIKEKLLLEILEKQESENLDETKELDFDELEQIVAAKKEIWKIIELNQQPEQEVVRKDGKTIIRTMIPDF